jgi:hypothetical protein
MKINSVRKRHYTERFLHNGFNVYLDSNASKVIDKFFQDNKIWALDFKSKTWAKMVRMSNKLDIAAMRERFGIMPEITYSVYTGCSMCPCSPGFRVRKAFGVENREFANCDVWAKVTVDVSGIEAALPKFKKMLEAEIEAYTKA